MPHDRHIALSQLPDSVLLKRCVTPAVTCVFLSFLFSHVLSLLFDFSTTVFACLSYLRVSCKISLFVSPPLANPYARVAHWACFACLLLVPCGFNLFVLLPLQLAHFTSQRHALFIAPIMTCVSPSPCCIHCDILLKYHKIQSRDTMALLIKRAQCKIHSSCQVFSSSGRRDAVSQ
jgi:hypothetical protein